MYEYAFLLMEHHVMNSRQVCIHKDLYTDTHRLYINRNSVPGKHIKNKAFIDIATAHLMENIKYISALGVQRTSVYSSGLIHTHTPFQTPLLHTVY